MIHDDQSYNNKLEHCNRCCSGRVYCKDGIVICENCNHSEDFSEWQLRGWRDLSKNQPTFGGTIHVYGKAIGRQMAKWDNKTKTCDNSQATHWLRVPDPRKQINMSEGVVSDDK